EVCLAAGLRTMSFNPSPWLPLWIASVADQQVEAEPGAESRYASVTIAAIESHLGCAAATARARVPIRSSSSAPRAVALLKPCVILSARAPTGMAAWSVAGRPRGPPSGVMKDGFPAAAAAKTDSDTPSHRDGWTKTSAAANMFALSSPNTG